MLVNLRRGDKASLALLIVAGMALAIQVLFLFGALYNPAGSGAPSSSHLLPWARALFYDDSADSNRYHFMIVLVPLTGMLFVWYWRRQLRLMPEPRQAKARTSLPTLWLIVMVSVLGIQVVLRASTRITGPALAAVLAATTALAILVCWLIAKAVRPRNKGRRPASTEREVRGPSRGENPTTRWRPWRLSVDALVLLLIVLLLYVPDYRSLAGTFFGQESFHHWDFFAMAPTIAYLKGAIPVWDSFSLYGLGIPAVFAVVSRLVSFSYGNVVRISVMYGIVYFAGLYVFLRVWLRDQALSFAGLAAALGLQQFRGLGLGEVLWRHPSSTVMRFPMDIFFFLAILLHHRYRHRAWLAVAGAITGLAVFWETDTGLYLALALLFYCGYVILTQPNRRAESLIAVGASFGLAAVVFMGATWLVVGGRVLHLAFWMRFFEPIQRALGGYYMLPLPTLDVVHLPVFLTPAIYLFFVTFYLLDSESRLNGGDGILLFVIGVYGLGLYHLYIGRSHPYNWFHVSIPLVLIVTYCLSRVLRSVSKPVGLQVPFSLGAVVLAVGLLLTAPAFKVYPNVFWRASGQTQQTVWNMRGADFKTVDPLCNGGRQAVASATSRISQLVLKEEKATVIANNDTLYYVLANRRPFYRYTPLLPNILTYEQRSEVLRAVRRSEFVFVDPSVGQSAPSAWWPDLRRDVYEPLYAAIKESHRYKGRAGCLEVWER